MTHIPGGGQSDGKFDFDFTYFVFKTKSFEVVEKFASKDLLFNSLTN